MDTLFPDSEGGWICKKHKQERKGQRYGSNCYRCLQDKTAQLQAELQQVKEELDKHRWIPVSERLPETVDDVELMYPDGLIIKGYYSKPSFYPNYDIDIERDSVTHWKPIILPDQALKPEKQPKLTPKGSTIWEHLH